MKDRNQFITVLTSIGLVVMLFIGSGWLYVQLSNIYFQYSSSGMYGTFDHILHVFTGCVTLGSGGFAAVMLWHMITNVSSKESDK